MLLRSVITLGWERDYSKSGLFHSFWKYFIPCHLKTNSPKSSNNKRPPGQLTLQHFRKPYPNSVISSCMASLYASKLLVCTDHTLEYCTHLCHCSRVTNLWRSVKAAGVKLLFKYDFSSWQKKSHSPTHTLWWALACSTDTMWCSVSYSRMLPHVNRTSFNWL